MCTVSFVAAKSGFIITSNRDEAVIRTARAPQEYFVNNNKLFFPKDPRSGGTWYAVNQNGNVLVLLNGAAEKHDQKPSYSRSRGLIVLEMLSESNPILHWNKIDLRGVEPFTLVLFQNERLYQLRWNETEKSVVELDVLKAYIWSSATLYSFEIQQKRAKWFFDFLHQSADVSANDLLDFHKNSHAENIENGLVINRNSLLKTLSITQAVINEKHIYLVYNDLVKNEMVTNLIEIQ